MMKILIMSIGTRGNMEPFLAIAEMLKAKGHEVICAFPEQFRTLAEETGVKFISLGPEFIDLINSDIGKLAIGGKEPSIRKTRAILDVFKKGAPIQAALIERQHDIVEKEKPDKILFNVIPFNAKVIYPLLWGIKNSAGVILVSPVLCIIHYVKGRPNAGFTRNYGAVINKFTFDAVNFDYVSMFLKTADKYFKDLCLNRKQILNALLSLKCIYTVSPAVFPRPDYWPPNATVLGYQERDKTLNWTPDPELAGFTERHDKILFVTFGSMPNPDPMKMTNMFVGILEKHNIPAILNLSGGGITEPPQYNKDLIKFTPYIPYNWICPKVYGVIQHGGAGTTQCALKHGCVTMVIPHITEQPVWNNIVYKLGVGPKGIAASKLSKEKLEPKILDLWTNASYKKRAMEISDQMKHEDYTDELYKAIME